MVHVRWVLLSMAVSADVSIVVGIKEERLGAHDTSNSQGSAGVDRPHQTITHGMPYFDAAGRE